MAEAQTQQPVGTWGDLWTRMQQETQKAVGDIYTYYAQQQVQQIVKVGEGQGGNKTAAELAAGQTGAPPLSMNLATQQLASNPMVWVGAAAALAGIYFLVKRK